MLGEDDELRAAGPPASCISRVVLEERRELVPLAVLARARRDLRGVRLEPVEDADLGLQLGDRLAAVA